MKAYDFNRCFDYENGFYLTSSVSRMGKLLAQYELYKTIVPRPGHIIECGVFKGASLVRWATFRELLESPYAREIIGFDTFDAFPESEDPVEQSYVDKFTAAAGSFSLDTKRLQEILSFKNITNVTLVEGDINHTVPEYVRRYPHLKIALLHIDTDLYKPAATAFRVLYDHVVSGGIIVLDDYGTFPGETRAVDEFLNDSALKIEKLTLNHIPAFIRKP